MAATKSHVPEMDRFESMFVEGLYTPLQPSTPIGTQICSHSFAYKKSALQWVVLTQAAEEEQSPVLPVSSSSCAISLHYCWVTQHHDQDRTTEEKENMYVQMCVHCMCIMKYSIWRHMPFVIEADSGDSVVKQTKKGKNVSLHICV